MIKRLRNSKSLCCSIPPWWQVLERAASMVSNARVPEMFERCRRCFSKNYINLPLDFWNQKSMTCPFHSHVFVYFSHLKMVNSSFDHIFFTWHLGWHGWISSNRFLLEKFQVICLHWFLPSWNTPHMYLDHSQIRKWSRNLIWGDIVVILVTFNKRVTCPYAMDNELRICHSIEVWKAPRQHHSSDSTSKSFFTKN